MKIAIPIVEGRLSMHFGHCEEFAVIEVDYDRKLILQRENISAPPHEPGLLPRWLAERGVQVVIAGGMGQRAKEIFSQNNIEVIVGAPAEAPERLVSDYLTGSLQVGENVCDH